MDPRKAQRIQDLMDRLERLERNAVQADQAALEVERRAILEEVRRAVGPAFTLYRSGNNLGAVSLAG